MHKVTDPLFRRRPGAVLVGVAVGRNSRAQAEENLQELSELARAAGVDPAGIFLQERDAIDPAFYLGRGKVQEIAEEVKGRHIEMAIFDDELSPNQHRNLEGVLHCRVLDRTLLVLDIFASRAKTSEGKLQVELAQLSYLLPRLSGKGVELSRLGGGIGTRGPGEAKLETDRRRIRKRIAALRNELASVKNRRAIHREARREIPAATVAVVGYTNAGKSTLFNALTQSMTPSSPKLFATLDPLVRGMKLQDGRLVLVSDTVGFIRKLPHQLVAAFRATLEEVTAAELLLHIVDASAENYRRQMRAVTEVLDSLECRGAVLLHVFNKVDLLDEASRSRLEREVRDDPQSVLVSAATGTGLPELGQMICSYLPDQRVPILVSIPYEEQHLRATLYEVGQVVSEQFLGGAVRIEALIDPATRGLFAPYRLDSSQLGPEPASEGVDLVRAWSP